MVTQKLPGTSTTDESTWCLWFAPHDPDACRGAVADRVYPEAGDVVDPVFLADRYCDAHWAERTTHLRPYLRVRLITTTAHVAEGTMGWTHDGDPQGAEVIFDNGYNRFVRTACLRIVEATEAQRSQFRGHQNALVGDRGPTLLWDDGLSAQSGVLLDPIGPPRPRIAVNPAAEDPRRPPRG